MPQSYQDKIELLKKAREAKKAKYDAIKQEKIDNPPPKGRPKKEVKKTLDITEPAQEVPDEELEEIIKPSKQEVEEVYKIKNTGNPPKRTSKKLQSQIDPEPEPEIVEEVEVRKIKKPKRRIVRKIIKEQYDSASTEEEIEEVIYKPPKYKSKAREKEAVATEKPPELPEPIKQEIRQSKPILNIFGY